MKNFESKLAKLVHDYSIKGKVADEKFAYKVLELCLENYNISDYVKEFKLNKKDIPLKYQGGYNISGKILVVDIEELVNKTLEELFLDRINGIETTPYLNLVKINTTIVNVIVHEINHACQYKKCLEGKEDIEKKLLELSFQKNLSIIRNEEISSQKAGYYTLLDMELDREICYIALPSERMANITGLTTVHDICKDLPEKYKGNIDLYNEYILSCAKICAYREYSPTTFITYVTEVLKSKYKLPCSHKKIEELEEEYRQIAIDNNLTLDETIYLGLPIDHQDKQEILSRTEALKKTLYR